MEVVTLEKELNSLAYHGRGIVIGKSADGTKAVIAYFIMGRSENSRNRIFVEDGEGIRTQAFDESKMEDPHLIIYAPVRVLGNKSADGDGSSCQRYTYAYSNPLNGKGKFIHTYKCDGNPLPSYEGEPKTVVIPDTDIDTFTSMVWENLNADNKVSLFTRYIDIATGKYESRIINKNK